MDMQRSVLSRYHGTDSQSTRYPPLTYSRSVRNALSRHQTINTTYESSAALPFIEEALARWTPRRAASGERLIELLKTGYDLGLNGRRPCEKRDDLYDR